MPELPSDRKWYISPGSSRVESLTVALRGLAARLVEKSPEQAPGVFVSRASEILEREGRDLPLRALDRETRHLIISDVPVPALMRLPTLLRLHKPDLRLHVTEDPISVRRLIVAQARPEPAEGIVDAYVVGSDLFVVFGDLTIRRFPIKELSMLDCVDEVADFRIDVDGSFIEWPRQDLHVDASGLLKEVDPTCLAQLEMERLPSDRTGEALARMRDAAGLRQVDVEGLSERHVRRIEKGVSELTLEAARSFATAFEMELGDFLNELAARVSDLAEKVGRMEETPYEDSAVA